MMIRIVVMRKDLTTVYLDLQGIVSKNFPISNIFKVLVMRFDRQPSRGLKFDCQPSRGLKFDPFSYPPSKLSFELTPA